MPPPLSPCSSNQAALSGQLSLRRLLAPKWENAFTSRRSFNLWLPRNPDMKLSIDRYLGRYPTLSAFLYLTIVIALGLSALLCLFDSLEIYRARDRSSERLARIKDRTELAIHPQDVTADPWPAGSPFLEGQTVTIAGASLLQRITESIVRAGGSVDSSEINTQESQLKNGYLKGMAIFEIEQTALQTFLYDIEGSMPFLFVDELVVNAPSSNTAGKTRVLVQISGRWWVAK